VAPTATLSEPAFCFCQLEGFFRSRPCLDSSDFGATLFGQGAGALQGRATFYLRGYRSSIAATKLRRVVEIQYL